MRANEVTMRLRLPADLAAVSMFRERAIELAKACGIDLDPQAWSCRLVDLHEPPDKPDAA